MSRLHALPQLVVAMNGNPLAREDARTLAEVRVQQRLSAPSLCELTFLEPPATGGIATLEPGVALRLAMRDRAESLFAGQVTAVEHLYGPGHEREVRVRGYDLLHQLRKRQPVRAHVEVTLADLARELTVDLGLTVAADETGPLRQRLIQHRQSDWELLVEQAEGCGLFLTLRDDVLHLMTLQGISGAATVGAATGGAEVLLTLGESLLEARVEVNGELACRGVTTAGWDPLRIEPHAGSAATARVGREALASASPARVGGTGERVLAAEAVQDDLQAEALAQAELDWRAAREVTLWGVAEGDPRLRPGAAVIVRGLAPSLAGRYVLTAVTHTVDTQKGFVSEISSAPPLPLDRPRGTVVALGTVTRVDDPDGWGRVKVALPAYSDVETEWMGVVTAGAGSGKGLISLPDVGDRVLLLFAQGDPAQGVVLGGLYGVGGLPDAGVEEGAVRRYTFLTPGGQRMRLDDTNKVLRIENSEGSSAELSPDKVRLENRAGDFLEMASNTVRLESGAGSFLEMTPEQVLLHAAARLEIEAPGQEIVIRGESVDFQRG